MTKTWPTVTKTDGMKRDHPWPNVTKTKHPREATWRPRGVQDRLGGRLTPSKIEPRNDSKHNCTILMIVFTAYAFAERLKCYFGFCDSRKHSNLDLYWSYQCLVKVGAERLHAFALSSRNYQKNIQNWSSIRKHRGQQRIWKEHLFWRLRFWDPSLNESVIMCKMSSLI